MSTINLVIGGVDVSPYVVAEGYTVKQIQKKSENSNFTKYDGTEVSEVLGYYYEISANLELVPNDIANALGNAMLEEEFNVSFTCPFGESASFKRNDSASFTVAAEVDDGLLWDVKISLKSELDSSEAGGGL